MALEQNYYTVESVICLQILQLTPVTEGVVHLVYQPHRQILGRARAFAKLPPWVRHRRGVVTESLVVRQSSQCPPLAPHGRCSQVEDEWAGCVEEACV